MNHKMSSIWKGSLKSMKTAYAYYRLSNEEKHSDESGSIANQRQIVRAYCERHGYVVVNEYIDDGYSGANFNRPGFRQMLCDLQARDKKKVDLVITKDLSRLGRDMREASYYAEQFFLDIGIRYIAIGNNFDNHTTDVMAPFTFAMNEVYLRESSRKIKDVINSKKRAGQYCCCPPYGYKKNPQDPYLLIPDPETAPIVQKIFELAASGYSTRKIEEYLNEAGVTPPLKYRVLYRDNFGAAGASHASDLWNYTTVKRILQNRTYLGHTMLGRTKKVSIRSDKKVSLPEDQWAITPNTHEPLVSECIFERAKKNLANNTKEYRKHPCFRKSIFSKIAFCAECGYSMCSGGSVYKGERESYWYLVCNRIRFHDHRHCAGARIRYYDLLKLVTDDLNQLIGLTAEQKERIIQQAIHSNPLEQKDKETQIERMRQRIIEIDKIMSKLYTDNALGKLNDARLERMVSELERESNGISKRLQYYEKQQNDAEKISEQYKKFFALVNAYTQIDELTREHVLTFIDRIEISRKNVIADSKHGEPAYEQTVKIYYKFVGQISPLEK